MKTSLPLAAVAAFVGSCTAATQTWPSPNYDEIEDILYLLNGHNSRGFAQGLGTFTDGVSSCTLNGNRAIAGFWIRTAFHDVATGDVTKGTGGVDGSLAFELNTAENVGIGFATTLGRYADFFSSRASLADLVALGTVVATRACAGPVVPMRVGWIDATAAGPTGVPDQADSLETLEGDFARIGFTPEEMIQVTACGHTVGGVHNADFPAIVAGTDTQALDSSTTVFDNKVVTDYLAGQLNNPLVANPANQVSDLLIFNSDGNKTMQAMSSADQFAATCAKILQKMVEVVPAGVELSQNAVTPYDVKPSGIQLALQPGGTSLTFSGEIRIRTTVRSAANIAGVQLAYTDRNGNPVAAPIVCSQGATASGFDDTFTFFSFNTKIDTQNSISSFKVIVNIAGGTSETWDNNGVGFPMQDNIMLQSAQSCLSSVANTDGSTNFQVVAAVRKGISAANLDMSLLLPRSPIPVPALSFSVKPMTQGVGVGPYNLFSATFAVPAAASNSFKFDVSTSINGVTVSDSFHDSSNVGQICAAMAEAPDLTTTLSSSSLASTLETKASSISVLSSATTLPTNSSNSLVGPSSLTSDSMISISLISNSTATTTSSGSATTTSSKPSATVHKTTASANSISTVTSAAATTLDDPPLTPSLVNLPVSSSRPSTSTNCSTSPNTNTSPVTWSSTRVASAVTVYVCAATARPYAAAAVPPLPTGTWTSVGCYTDLLHNNTRILANSLTQIVRGGSANMTNEGCQEAARAAGFSLAGTEFSGQCWAGNDIVNGGAPEVLMQGQKSACTYKCTGAARETCGGAFNMNLWKLPGGVVKA